MRFLASLAIASLLLGHTGSKSSAKLLATPFGRATAFVSPDGRHALWGDYPNSKLWIEDTASHAERPVQPFTVQTISLAWSLDSRHFVVNDRETSSESEAYLFDTETLERTNLRDELLAAQPGMRHYLLNGKHPTISHGRHVMHSYLDVRRWTDDRHVELQVHGTFDGRFRHDDPDSHLYPAGCFDVRFSMGLDGSVKKLSEHVMEPVSNSSACGWGPE